MAHAASVASACPVGMYRIDMVDWSAYQPPPVKCVAPLTALATGCSASGSFAPSNKSSPLDGSTSSSSFPVVGGVAACGLLTAVINRPRAWAASALSLLASGVVALNH